MSKLKLTKEDIDSDVFRAIDIRLQICAVTTVSDTMRVKLSLRTHCAHELMACRLVDILQLKLRTQQNSARVRVSNWEMIAKIGPKSDLNRVAAKVVDRLVQQLRELRDRVRRFERVAARRMLEGDRQQMSAAVIAAVAAVAAVAAAPPRMSS